MSPFLALLISLPEALFLGFMAWQIWRDARASAAHRRRMENEYAAFVAALRELAKKEDDR